MPRYLSSLLFALCPRFEAGVFRPYLVFRLHRICLTYLYLSLCGRLSVAWGCSPLNAPSMGHDGPLFPVSPMEVAILSGFLAGIARVLPPLSRDQTNKMTDGGDFPPVFVVAVV